MGKGGEYFCSVCKKRFIVSYGCGMGSVSLHCELCGTEKFARLFLQKHDERRFLLLTSIPSMLNDFFNPDKGLFTPSDRLPKAARKALDAYLDDLEKALCVKRCKCGGRWSPVASGSCPICHAKEGDQGIERLSNTTICWD